MHLWRQSKAGVQVMMVLVVIFFRFFEINYFWFVVALFDLVHDVEAIDSLYLLLTPSGNLFGNMTDASETANCSFTGIIHISEKKKIFICCKQLRKVIYSLHGVH